MLIEGMKMNPIMVKLLIIYMTPKVMKAFWLNGIGRFKEEEIYEKGERLIESVVTTMGDNKFFFGDKLSTLDLSIYGHFGGMYQLCSIPSKLPYMKEINEYMKRIEIGYCLE